MSNDMLGKIAPADLAGPMITFWQRVSGPEGAAWIEAFKRFLRKENPWPKESPPAPNFADLPVWRTVEIGRHKSAEAMLAALDAADCRATDWARDILAKTSFAQELQTLELVSVTVEGLGFPQGATRKEIYDAAVAAGLRLCPAEVGPALREQYADQLMDEWRLIAMDPITDSGGHLGVFNVERSAGGRWLNADRGHPDSRWAPGRRWVFLRRKQ